MDVKRLVHSLMLKFIPSAFKRAEYCKKHKVFKHQGNNCSFMFKAIPLYSELISIGDNVHIASNVGLVTHDITHLVLNNDKSLNLARKIAENRGCIKIGNNVFIGAGSRILSDVQIGNNVIVGAGAIVNKDIPDNSVVAGVPAKVIHSYSSFAEKRIENSSFDGKSIDDLDNIEMWHMFDEKRKKDI